MNVSRAGTVLASALALSSVMLPAKAAEEWWFDVEVIIFDRNTALSQLEEQFELADNVYPATADADVIGDVVHPDISRLKQGLARCDGSDAPLYAPPLPLDDLVARYGDVMQAADAKPQHTNIITDTPATLSGGGSGVVTRLPADEPGSAPPAPDDQQIASYWISFSGIENIEPVTVPRFRYCEDNPPWLAYTQQGWQRHTPDNRLPAPDQLPVELNGNDWPRAAHAHLLSVDARELEKLSAQIRRSRDLNRLLHVTWRQEVMFGQENAARVRLFAGKNYASQFTLLGTEKSDGPVETPLVSEQPEAEPRSLLGDNFFGELQTRLNANTPVDFSEVLQQRQQEVRTDEPGPIRHIDEHTPIWEVDGYMRVFLKYINRVPYLHIDSELFYRQPVPVQGTENGSAPEYKLASVPLKQLRRVISKQLHYFDHPLFGVVVEIRRYERPDLPAGQQ
ncbi:peptidoglycan binding protein CsiV [Alteromonas sp. ASW11-19]|uniref:Peptidoglycan binding protein CsiV n=1 Tax=Alteromonas salexigens TaxID=2982530 RepID=A0ABT2VLH0_9ALTE|nr:peptidoglycan binding protein CsiV [Alteromonas salexigens]MCU7553899.1 peptidoglycan binding protein CsiV [Alteromonas salexigens]